MSKEFLAFPTVTRTNGPEPTQRGAPYRIYAVNSVEISTIGSGYFQETDRKVGMPPFYKVVGASDGKLKLDKLSDTSNEFRNLAKWVGCANYGNKSIFNNSAKSGVIVTETEALELIAESSQK